MKLSIGKTAIAGTELYTNEAIAALIPQDKNIILDKYIFFLFNSGAIELTNVGDKAFGKSLNSSYLNEQIIIPVPPLEIQSQTIRECEKLSVEYNTTRMSREDYCDKIRAVFYNFEIIIYLSII